jgi:two-component system, response regulator PdtaR
MTASEPEMVSPDRRSKPVAILVVEAETLVASYIGEVLEESGFAVAGVVSTGAEALSLAAATRPRLALVDIRLAGLMDGVEVARLLRERFAVPTIFLSGLGDAATMARARCAQPLGFLKKPFRPSQMFNAIERVLKQSE